MGNWWTVILLLVLIFGEIQKVMGTGRRILVRKRNNTRVSENVAQKVGSDLVHESKSRKKRQYSEEWAERCGDDESYYFAPLNECYRIFRAQMLNVDPDRRIAYGGTRNEYMFNCWQQYNGKLLDIGWEHIGEKMKLVKQMVTDFNRGTFKRQAIQVGFMINRQHELIAQNGEHYDVLENVFVEHEDIEDSSMCPSVCCLVFLADTRIRSVRLVETSCDNRTRALSYICEAPAFR